MTAAAVPTERLAALLRGALAGAGLEAHLTLADARRLAALAEAEAVRMSLPVVVAVVDGGGRTILLHRMDGALPAATGIALDKAVTAATFRMPTHALGEQARPGGPLQGLTGGPDGRVVLFGGGYPCQPGGRTTGALGISGGTVAEDMEIASRALGAFMKETGATPKGGQCYG